MQNVQVHHKKLSFKKSRNIFKLLRLSHLILFVLIIGAQENAFTQGLNHQQFWDSLVNIERSNKEIKSRLELVIDLKNEYEKSGYQKDSVYARMLHRIGFLKFTISNRSNDANKQTLQISKNINDAITFTLEAAKINTSGKKNSCPSYAANSYSNLGYYCKEIQKYKQALSFYDSSISISKKFPEDTWLIEMAHLYKGEIYYKTGNYQQIVSESSLGLQVSENLSDTEYIVDCLNKRAEAYEILGEYKNGLNDLTHSALILQKSPNDKALINVYLTKAKIAADQKDFLTAKNLLKNVIDLSEKNGDDIAAANYYNEAGLVLQFKCNNISEALKYYMKASLLAVETNATLINIFTKMNIGQVYFSNQQYAYALSKTQEAIVLCTNNKFHPKDLLENPMHSDVLFVDSKNYLGALLDNKAECLLNLYKKTNDKNYLITSISSALLSDTLITDMRHDQADEQSKLYWTNFTRQLYARSIEACYLSNNPSLAFYFMEKSRAVLLNDKLNELGAAAQLPSSETANQESFQINIVEQQQKLSSLNESSPQYAVQQLQLLNAKEDYDHYIKSLEQKYPTYYQYKYSDEVPSLKNLQDYLSKNNQSLVHYFMEDTVTYILAVTANSTKFIRLLKKDFNSTQLFDFIKLCSDKQYLNSHYPSFATLSNSIYKNLFQSLQLQKGRVIICPDNFLIPFEALCTDAGGKNFLINDYSFTYVYAARNLLMKQINNNTATGNFLGFAPVSFSSYLGVPDLTNSSKAINVSAANYSINKIFTEKNASRKNFFLQLPDYNIVNIFSHAVADSTDNEPRLYMQDSVIHLSELQMINHPATQLVVLSACQTNVGKNATGEGIYSLARGFASVGIPAVSATLWEADEDAIYSITEMFNKNLAKGMQKDEALQQAKLSFIQTNSGDKLLPYYWANMILVGNTDPVKLSADNHFWWWIAGGGFLLLAVAIFFWRRKTTTSKN